MSIVDANMCCNKPIKINGYCIEYSRIYPSSTYTRTLLFINDKIAYIRHSDLEDSLKSSTWIEISINKTTKLDYAITTDSGHRLVS